VPELSTLAPRACSTKSAFRNAVVRRRCLIPADASTSGRRPAGRPTGAGVGARQPWCYRSPDGGPLAFGGLWEAWKARPDGSAGPGGSRGRAARHRLAPWAPAPDGDDPAAVGWHDDWCSVARSSRRRRMRTVAPVHDRMPLVLHPDNWERGSILVLSGGRLAWLLRTPPVGPARGLRGGAQVNASSAEGPQLVQPLAEAAEGSGAGATEPTLF